MRIFLAIEIPESIKKKLVEVQKQLEPQIAGVRWEKPEKLHLTLVFLGNVKEERVEELEKVVREVIKGVKGIKTELAGVGVFPKNRPRVVLVEVGGGAEKLGELQKRLAESLSAAGFDFARLSKPHVTLGRFKKGVKGIKGVKDFEGLGESVVKEVLIMQSTLRRGGSVYKTLSRIPFLF